MRVLSIFVKGLLSIIATFLLAISLWYAISYAPYLGELKALSATSQKKPVGDFAIIKKLVIAADSWPGVGGYVARSSYSELSYKDSSIGGNIVWHLNHTLWYFANTFHFDDDELIYLWLSYGNVRENAIKYFGSPLSELGFEQKLQLISMVKGPGALHPGTELGKKRAEIVLRKYNGL